MYKEHEIIDKLFNEYKYSGELPDLIKIKSIYGNSANKIASCLVKKLSNASINNKIVKYIIKNELYKDVIILEKLVNSINNSIQNSDFSKNDFILIKNKLKDLRNNDLISKAITDSNLFDESDLCYIINNIKELHPIATISYYLKFFSYIEKNLEPNVLLNNLNVMLNNVSLQSLVHGYSVNNHDQQSNKLIILMVELLCKFFECYRKNKNDVELPFCHLKALYYQLSSKHHSNKLAFNYGYTLTLLGQHETAYSIYLLLHEIELNNEKYSSMLALQLIDVFFSNKQRLEKLLTSAVKLKSMSKNLSLILQKMMSFCKDNKYDPNVLNQLNTKDLNSKELSLFLLYVNNRMLPGDAGLKILNHNMIDTYYKQFITFKISNSISDVYNSLFRQYNQYSRSSNLFVILSSNPNLYELYKRNFSCDVLFVSDKIFTYYTYRAEDFLLQMIDNYHIDLYKQIVLIGGSKAGFGAILWGAILSKLLTNNITINCLCFSPQLTLTNTINNCLSDRFPSLRVFKYVFSQLNWELYTCLNKYGKLLSNEPSLSNNVKISIFFANNNYFDNIEIKTSNISRFSNVSLFPVPFKSSHNIMRYFIFDKDCKSSEAHDYISSYMSIYIYDYL